MAEPAGVPLSRRLFLHASVLGTATATGVVDGQAVTGEHTAAYGRDPVG
ncbi:hypothetical protein [Saccharothrix lopnurensis]|uniref:Uncharacterized protein n=1 Tax=Saccharothrix lopnurensis TaxID=1670621 RepID=A0ABW1NYF1_9PSEU